MTKIILDKRKTDEMESINKTDLNDISVGINVIIIVTLKKVFPNNKSKLPFFLFIKAYTRI
jgi:hypothetical protein